MSDLNRFKELYDPEKFKDYPGKLEVRAGNLDLEMAEARKVVQDNNLNLVVVTNATLTSYRAFEVREL